MEYLPKLDEIKKIKKTRVKQLTAIDSIIQVQAQMNLGKNMGQTGSEEPLGTFFQSFALKNWRDPMWHMIFVFFNKISPHSS